MHIALSEDTTYIAFRGTADSLVGWKEDFSMSFQVMPAQTLAEKYIKDTCSSENVLHYYVGGHSKGGNLALYAAATASDEFKGKILQVYSNDGPGLCKEIIDEQLVESIRDRLTRIVPEFSVVGSLFKTDARTIIVKSSFSGVMEHDALSWEVEGDSFVTCREHSRECDFYNEVIGRWIESEDMEHRAAFTNDLFSAMEATGAKNLSDMSGQGVDDFLVILLSVTQSDHKTRGVLLRFGQTFVSGIKRANWEVLARQKEVILAFALIILGMFISLYPGRAVEMVMITAGVAAAIYLGKRLLDTAFSEGGTVDAKKIKMVLHMIGMCLLIYLVAERTILLQLSNILIGIVFLLVAYRWLVKAFSYNRLAPKAGGIILAIVAFAAGMLPLVENGLNIEAYMISVGALFWIYGIGTIVYQAYKNGQKNRDVTNLVS